MTKVEGGVAVVTGAAGGIGRSLALAFAREGMSVVISDRDAAGLTEVSTLIKETGQPCETVVADVSCSEDVDALAQRTRSAFGNVTVVCSNAGVMIPGAVWEVTPEHWAATLGVNVMGSVHLARSFIPDMIASGRPGHFVITVGLVGLFTSAFSPPGSYAVSKHAALAFAEVLQEELHTIDAPIGVTALLPAGVRTRFAADRSSADGDVVKRAAIWPMVERLRSSIRTGMDPDDVALAAMKAIAADEFWAFTHPDAFARVEHRFGYVLSKQTPTSPYGR